MLSRGHACGRKKNGLSSSINVNLSLNKCIKVLLCSFESLLHLYFINRQSFSEQCVSTWNVFFPRTKLKLRREPVVEPFFRFISLFQLYKQSLYGFQKVRNSTGTCFPSISILYATSIPECTFTKTACFPSNQLVVTVLVLLVAKYLKDWML